MFRKTHHFRTWFEGDYIYDSYKISYFDIISKFIMWKILKMNYYWIYSKSLGFMKCWDLNFLLNKEE